MKRILLVCFMLMSALIGEAWAQRTISGTVTSGANGEPLPGVAVQVQGTTTGVTTDFEGNYRLQVPEDANTLVYRFVGFETQRVQIGNRSVIDVVLQEDVTQLQEVVVSALGIERSERSIGYSAQTVSGDQITQARESNVVNSLAGRVAGVQITGGSTQGGSSRIVIRGANSITGNNQPLFVVDGVPIDNSNFASTNQQRGAGGFDYGNMIQDLNPDDIASINVLKGPSAAALYGTRGANGVIVITTKRGTKREGVGVTVNSGLTFDNVLVYPDYQNLYGGGYSTRFTRSEEGQLIPNYGADESWGPRMDGRLVRHWDSWEGENEGELRPWAPSPDNVENFFETGTTWSNSVAVSGGGENATFRLSYSRLDQDFIVPNGELTRNTVTFSGSADLTDRFRTALSGSFINNAATGRLGTGYGEGTNVAASFNQWFQRQVDIDRLRDYRLPDGTQRTWNRKSAANPTPNYWDNPYWARYENFQNDQRNRLFGNIASSYDLTDDLKLAGKLMIDTYTDRRMERVAIGSQAISDYTEAVRQFQEVNAELRLEYSRQVSEDLDVSGFIGGNWMNQRYDLNWGSAQGGLSVANFYSLENSIDRPEIEEITTEREIQSLYGSASVGYRDMAYLDVSLRNDWSSTLPLGENSYLYPGVSASFVFTEVIPRTFLEFGKIRAGWALAGNDTDPYRLYTVYNPEQGFGNDPVFTVPNERRNPNLVSEKTVSYEVGADLRFFNSRLVLDVAWYRKRSFDLIFPVDASATTGFTRLIVNAGEMRNQGVELALGGSPVVAGDFRWDVNLNWATNDNEVVELIEGVNSYTFTSLFGGALQARVGEKYAALVGRDFVYDEATGEKIIDPETGSYQLTGADQVLGSTLADWTGGIRNAFSYKGFNLAVLIDGQAGGSVYSITNMFGKYSGLTEETVANDIRQLGVVFDGVVIDDEGNTTPNDIVLPAPQAFGSLFGAHRAYVYDASYAKLREITFGYTLPGSLVENTPFRNVRLSIIGRNLAILYKRVPHIDPETTTNSGNIQGIEGAATPSTRSFGFNLSLSL